MRAARMTDVFAMVDLLCLHHDRSRYAGVCGVDREYARKMLAQAVQRHGGAHDGGSFVMVVDDENAKLVGFMVGVLSRVYEIGDKLVAQDMFLVAAPDAPAITSLRLLSSYIQWAERSPHVVEIHLSHTDVLPEGDRMGDVYRRFGFSECGAIYRRAREDADAKEAA